MKKYQQELEWNDALCWKKNLKNVYNVKLIFSHFFSLLLFKENTYVQRLRNRECLRNFMSYNAEKIRPIGLNDAKSSTNMFVFLLGTTD